MYRKEPTAPYTFVTAEEHAERERQRMIGVAEKKAREERLRKLGEEFK